MFKTLLRLLLEDLGAETARHIVSMDMEEVFGEPYSVYWSCIDSSCFSNASVRRLGIVASSNDASARL